MMEETTIRDPREYPAHGDQLQLGTQDIIVTMTNGPFIHFTVDGIEKIEPYGYWYRLVRKAVVVKVSDAM